jgi:hypothetical protein
MYYPSLLTIQRVGVQSTQTTPATTQKKLGSPNLIVSGHMDGVWSAGELVDPNQAYKNATDRTARALVHSPLDRSRGPCCKKQACCLNSVH